MAAFITIKKNIFQRRSQNNPKLKIDLKPLKPAGVIHSFNRELSNSKTFSSDVPESQLDPKRKYKYDCDYSNQIIVIESSDESNGADEKIKLKNGNIDKDYFFRAL